MDAQEQYLAGDVLMLRAHGCARAVFGGGCAYAAGAWMRKSSIWRGMCLCCEPMDGQEQYFPLKFTTLDFCCLSFI